MKDLIFKLWWYLTDYLVDRVSPEFQHEADKASIKLLNLIIKGGDFNGT